MRVLQVQTSEDGHETVPRRRPEQLELHCPVHPPGPSLYTHHGGHWRAK